LRAKKILTISKLVAEVIVKPKEKKHVAI